MVRALLLIFALTASTMLTANTAQHAVAESITFEPVADKTGATDYLFNAVIKYDKSKDDFYKAGDTTEKIYNITIVLKEENTPVNLNSGYALFFSNESGQFVLKQQQKLSVTGLHNYSLKVTVPVAAMALTPGLHRLRAFITISDADGKTINKKQPQATLSVIIKPVINVTVTVPYIKVDSLDGNGELWDYFLLNPKESNPDIYWSLGYAGKTFFASGVVNNSFEFKDPQHLQQFKLAISEGDSLVISVKDKDNLTADDLVGDVICVPLASRAVEADTATKLIRQMHYILLPQKR